MDNPFESPALLSTCTGMLGLDEGLAAVLGSRTVAYVEIEAFVAENLVRKMEQGLLAPAPVWSNVKTFPWEAFYGKLHWITGGYPCQPFSHAGLRAGSADPRHLWPYLSGGIKKSRPMGVWFENVEGHITLGLRDVLTDLRRLGYQVEVGLFSAAEVGAPHRRNRVFILGLENSFLIRMRGWDDETRAYWRRKIQTPGSGQLADTGYLGQTQRQVESSGFEQHGELANTDIQRFGEEGRGENRVDQPSNGVGLADSHVGKSGEERGDDGQMCGFPEGERRSEHSSTVSGGGCVENMANPGYQGLQGSQWEGAFCDKGPASSGSTTECGDRWPARPGQHQHYWEAPRLESGVGYAVNGYNYREDLLRMAGNAVVHQQAEKAFRTLLMKFL